MITIFIDNKPYQVKEGQNLLQACLSLGFDLPYFCWHPAMHSVGACRQCAVKQFRDEKDTRGRIVMSCMTPLVEGMRVSVDDPEAKAFRTGITEYLMLNHPHDCPVCDEGGECHLQDMTVMTGHSYRRTRFKKRTHQNQYLGPFINHEMNRCIACYRCIRFYRGIAGGRDLNVFSSHAHVYFGRHKDGVLESEFSGNLVEICPTGVFTDKTFKKHYTRKWDLQTAPSICVHCGIGCNTIAGERYGTLRRISNRYNNEVNGYFLCDRGRFGYEFVNNNKRIRKPLVKSPSLNPSHQGGDSMITPSPLEGESWGEGGLKPADKAVALTNIADILSHSKTTIGIGSPRASLESNFVLRSLVGPDNFYSGMSPQEHKLTSLIIDILQRGPARTPSLNEVEAADAIFIVGEDVTNTAPMLALAIRQGAQCKQREIASSFKIPAWDDNAVRNAGQDGKYPVYIATPGDTKLDAIAAKTFRAAPNAISRLGFAVAHELDNASPSIPDLPSDAHSLAREIAAVLKNSKRPLIVSGTGCMNEAVIRATANIAWALCASGKQAGLCYTALECNAIGAGLFKSRDIDDLATQDIDTLIVLENDLYRRVDDKTVDSLLSKAKNIIVIDHLLTPTAAKADIALSAGTFAETSGTLVNNEGRAQRFYQVFCPDNDIQGSWKWIRDIMLAMQRHEAGKWQSLDGIIADMIAVLPIFGPIAAIAPTSDFRVNNQKIPRQSHRYSGRTAIEANISVHEPKPPEDTDAPLSFSMEGYAGQPPAPLIPRYWSAGWNSVQSLNKFQQEVGGPLRDEGPGTRLLDNPREQVFTFFNTIPDVDNSRSTISDVPTYRIFGSEELSSYSSGIQERIKATISSEQETP